MERIATQRVGSEETGPEMSIDDILEPDAYEDGPPVNADDIWAMNHASVGAIPTPPAAVVVEGLPLEHHPVALYLPEPHWMLPWASSPFAWLPGVADNGGDEDGDFLYSAPSDRLFSQPATWTGAVKADDTDPPLLHPAADKYPSPIPDGLSTPSTSPASFYSDLPYPSSPDIDHSPAVGGDTTAHDTRGSSARSRDLRAPLVDSQEPEDGTIAPSLRRASKSKSAVKTKRRKRKSVGTQPSRARRAAAESAAFLVRREMSTRAAAAKARGQITTQFNYEDRGDIPPVPSTHHRISGPSVPEPSGYNPHLPHLHFHPQILREEETVERHTCSCGKIFTRNWDLQRHQETAAEHRVQDIKCEGCGGHFSRRDALQRHKRKQGCGTRKE